MSAWRDILKKARQGVHRTFEVPALYRVRVGREPVRVRVRVHTRFATSDVSGVGEGFASLLDTTPRLIFDRAEINRPEHNALVVIGATEMYRVSHTRPPDGDYIAAEVDRLTDDECATIWRPEWEELLT